MNEDDHKEGGLKKALTRQVINCCVKKKKKEFIPGMLVGIAATILVQQAKRLL